MNGHHLILGELADFITGEPLKDTHDERYRQKLARLLVEEKGYSKSDILPRMELLVHAGNKRAILKIDFGVRLSGRIAMEECKFVLVSSSKHFGNFFTFQRIACLLTDCF